MLTDRQENANELKKTTVRACSSASASLKIAVEQLKLLIPYVHNSIIKADGEVSLQVRADLSKKLDPKLVEILGYVAEMQELASIYNEDEEVTYPANLAAYIEAHPETLDKVEAHLEG